jgi:cytochrome c553
MTPRPPYLPPRIDDYSPEELFYVVKHGIKFTGMPAWPAQQRDDEVRAVVAFLLRMPELDAAGYRRLVHGPVVPSPAVVPLREMPAGSGVPSAVTASCARCHGRDGLGRGNAAFPKLALQKRVYMSFALNAYARSQRNSGIMEPIAAALTPEERRELAAYYSALPAGPPAMMPAPRESRARGEAIAMRGVPERGVPSCMDCHGPSPHPRNPAYPNLAGQYADYIALQLELFAEQRRGGSSYAHIMRQVAARLTQQQRRDVAAYYSALPAGARDGG